MTGLEGAVFPGDEVAAWRLGITVKELRDCRRRLARARAWTSPAGSRETSGRAAGRISKVGEEGDVGEETGLAVGDSARTWLVSGEHGTLGLEGSSVLSQTDLAWGLSLSTRLWPPLTSKRWRKEDTD